MKVSIFVVVLCLSFPSSSLALFNNSIFDEIWDVLDADIMEQAFEKYGGKAQHKANIQVTMYNGFTKILRLKPNIESDAKVDLFTLYTRTWNQLAYYLAPLPDQLLLLFDTTIDIIYHVRQAQRQLNPKLNLVEIFSEIVDELSNMEFSDDLLLAVVNIVDEIMALKDSILTELDEIGQEFPNFDAVFLEYFRLVEDLKTEIYATDPEGYTEQDSFILDILMHVLFLATVTH